jgi:GH24 family phage-related lysozyme (muramidase)
MKIIITESQYRFLLKESSTLYDDPEFLELIKGYEGSVKTKDGKHITYDDVTSKPVVNPSQLQGTLTIGYGTTRAVYPEMKVGEKISEPKATELLKKGVEKIENKVKTLIPNYENFPKYVRLAIMNAKYRGDLGPKTIELINQGKWSQVSKEYLEHKNYKNPGNMTGVVKRMKANADAFDKYAEELKNGKSTTDSNLESTYSTEGISYVMLENELASLTSGKNYKLHRFPKDNFFDFRLEVGPYPPSKKEGRYLVFFRNGVIKWYNGNEFSGRGSWGYNIDQNKWRIIGKNGEISISTAINNPVSNFAKIE